MFLQGGEGGGLCSVIEGPFSFFVRGFFMSPCGDSDTHVVTANITFSFLSFFKSYPMSLSYCCLSMIHQL